MSETFSVSERAAKRVATLMAKEKTPGMRLRISIEGGGCSGFQYHFDFDNTVNDEDTVITQDGAEVVIDDVSLQMLNGSELDYIEELGSAFFAIKNPNAASTCGCGNSFSV